MGNCTIRLEPEWLWNHKIWISRKQVIVQRNWEKLGIGVLRYFSVISVQFVIIWCTCEKNPDLRTFERFPLPQFSSDFNQTSWQMQWCRENRYYYLFWRSAKYWKVWHLQTLGIILTWFHLTKGQADCQGPWTSCFHFNIWPFQTLLAFLVIFSANSRSGNFRWNTDLPTHKSYSKPRPGHFMFGKI